MKNYIYKINKKVALGVAGLVMGASFASAQVANLSTGWNNVGVVDNFGINTITNEHINLIWSYQGGQWRVYSPNPDYMSTINSIIGTGDVDYTVLSGTIPAGSALWIQTSEDTQLRWGENTIAVNITGVVRNASNYSVIDGASISLFRYGAEAPLADQILTSTSGEFEIRNVPGGQYRISITSEGFLDFSSTVDIQNDTNINLGQLYLVPDTSVDNVSVTGIISDSATGSNLNPTITVRVGHNNRMGDSLSTEPTVTNGSYSMNLAPGNYTFELSLDGYYTTYINMNITDSNTTRNFSMNSLLSGDAIARIKLDWGQNPLDLDSHLLIKDDAEYSAHVYYSSRNARLNTGDTLLATLDRDITSGFGPETITIYNTDETVSKRYSYYIYHYSGTSTLANSQAVVTVNYGGQEYVFNVPSGDTQRYWKVFDIIEGVFIPCVSECLVTAAPTLARIIGQDEDIATIRDAIQNNPK